MKHRVLITRMMPERANAAAAEMFDAVFPSGSDMDLAEALDRLRGTGAEGLLFATNLRLDAGAIAQLPAHLKVAATCSVGYDHIDMEAARARSLVVTNTPDVLTDCTADFAFMLILNACRRAAEYSYVIRTGRWTRPFGTHELLGRSLHGKTLGIVGMGRIGRAVAIRARAFGMQVAYHDRHEHPPQLVGDARFYPSLDSMLPCCDVLTLHAPATASNRHMMNARTIGMLPRGAVLVNTARGALVDEEALLDALDAGHLFGAGLDVFENEPAIVPRLLRDKRIFITPHMASATEETRTAMGMVALQNIDAVLSGHLPLTPV